MAAALGIFAIDKLTAWGSFVGPFVSIAGYGIVLISALIVLWAAAWFYKKKTPIEPHNIPKTIITSGPFRFSRNPIYLARVCALIGISLIISNWLGFLFSIGLMFVLDRRFIQDEEGNLLKKFGKEAQRYFQNTNKWL